MFESQQIKAKKKCKKQTAKDKYRQSSHKVLPSITSYYKARTKYTLRTSQITNYTTEASQIGAPTFFG